MDWREEIRLFFVAFYFRVCYNFPEKRPFFVKRKENGRQTA